MHVKEKKNSLKNANVSESSNMVCVCVCVCAFKYSCYFLVFVLQGIKDN